MIVESDRETAQLQLHSAMVTGRADVEFGLRTKTDEVRATRWSGRTFMRDEHPIFLAIGVDVTEMRDAEGRLRTNEAEMLRMARLDA